MKLNELVKIESGINSVRVKDQNYTLYTIEDVNYDLGHGEDYQHDKDSGKSITARGDIVINTVSNLASVVHSRNAGKMLNQIFLRLNILDENTLDPWYLCYLLNKSEYIRYQEAAIMDGSVIRKLTKANLEDLEINLQRNYEKVYISYGESGVRKRSVLTNVRGKRFKQQRGGLIWIRI